MPVTRQGSFSGGNSGVGKHRYITRGENENFGNALPSADTGFENTQPVDRNTNFGNNTSTKNNHGEKIDLFVIEGVEIASSGINSSGEKLTEPTDRIKSVKTPKAVHSNRR